MKSLLLLLTLSLIFTGSLYAQFGNLLGGGGSGPSLLDPKTLQSAGKVLDAAKKSQEDITPEQEYYIGRAVAANVTAQFKPYPIDKSAVYLNLIVQYLAQFSTRPDTFGGYHVLILDSNDINAFSAPGGLIFVTRGMLRCCTSETSLAAVLAHEIAHVAYQHGLQAIKKERLNNLMAVTATEGAKTFGNDDVKKLTADFGNSITDIAKTMINNGYSRDLETQADKGGVAILKASGYYPYGMVLMLQEMKKRLVPGRMDFAKTHPSPDDRIKSISGDVGKPNPNYKEPQAFTDRFSAALGGI